MPEVAPPSVQALLAGRHRILVTGGAGFNCCAEAKGYGGALVFNLVEWGHASDLTSSSRWTSPKRRLQQRRCRRCGPTGKV